MSLARHITVGLLIASTAQALATEPGPNHERRVGHKTCSGSLCHAATQPWMRGKDAEITQREFLVWQRDDAHASAYDVLLGETGKRIATNLGIAAAHRDPTCLKCHSDYVPPSKRAPDVVLSAGVTCEACHGGAADWLITHMSDDRATNLANGMYPTEDPVARAQLCTSCHVGTQDRAISHRLMGAGHPRLSFELDTFSSIMPPHWVQDADYVRRKGRVGSEQMWMVGQIVALERKMRQLETQPTDGIFPELSFFDCHGCHHNMSDPRWSPAMAPQPGVPRLEDSATVMVKRIADVVARDVAMAMTIAQDCLTDAAHTDWSKAPRCAEKMREIVAHLRAKVMATPLSDDALWTLLEGILASEPLDYADAEQACMGAHALYEALQTRGVVTHISKDTADQHFEQLYQALQDEEAYRAADAARSLAVLRQTLVRPSKD